MLGIAAVSRESMNVMSIMSGDMFGQSSDG